MPARVKYLADCRSILAMTETALISIIEAGDPEFSGKFEIGIAGKFNE